MKILLDTTPLYALLDRRDQAHQRALDLFGGAVHEALVCPLPVALELHGLLLKRKPNDPEAAHEGLRGVVRAYGLSYPTPEDVAAATELLRRYSDQRLTLTDALVASMAKREADRVMTFDARHFTLMGAAIYADLT